MDEVNKYQIGGQHYATETGYQHWDWAIDCCLGMLEYAATRYVIRKKKPEEDLQKAIHFVEKMIHEVKAGRYHSTYALMAQSHGSHVLRQRINEAGVRLIQSYYPGEEGNWRTDWCLLLAQWRKVEHLEHLKEELYTRLQTGTHGGIVTPGAGTSGRQGAGH